MGSGVRVALLGGFGVWLDRKPVEAFESDKVRGLLAYLAVEAGRPQRREGLAGLLWPELTEKRARRNLSQALHNLRRALGDVGRSPKGNPAPALLQADRLTIQFCPDDGVWLDTAVFNQGLDGCARHRPKPDGACKACLATMGDAVAVYNGPFLAGHSWPNCPEFENWVLLERERGHRRALATLEALAVGHRGRGEIERAMRFARRAVALDPLWERSRRELMRCLWLSGRRAEALAQFEACRQILADELGIEPDDETRKLARRIQIDAEIVSPRPTGRHNLPHALTPFIGREAEVAEVGRLLRSPDCRLLTLLGPGGSGKTRLAIEAARRLADVFPDGIFLVSLADLAGPEMLAPAVLETLGVPGREGPPPEEQLVDYLRQKRLLLVIDSCEAMPAGADLAVDLLRAAPGLKTLATSRVRLHVKGEHLLSVDGLPLPDERQDGDATASDAAALFLSAARRVRAGYAPDAGELVTITRICRLVGGMPLGIILATAWLEALSPADIAREIERSLDFLAVDWPDLPARQRSLRATLDYSWNLLDGRRRALFRALSIFSGGFDTAAAQKVAGATLTDLLALRQRSLLNDAGERRFQLHDLVRQHARERLAATPAEEARAEERHGEHYLRLLRAWEPGLKSGQQQEALERLERESANLAAAWRWAVAGARTDWLATALDGMCLTLTHWRRAGEGEFICRQASEALESLEGDGLLRTRVQVWRAHFLRIGGERTRSLQLLEECLARLEGGAATDDAWRVTLARLSLELGHGQLHTDRAGAEASYRRSLELFSAVGERWGVAQALVGLGDVKHHQGRLAEGIEAYRAGLGWWRELGDPRGLADTLNALGQTELRAGHQAEGERHVTEAMELYEALGDRAASAMGRFSLSRTRFWQGSLADSMELMRLALVPFRELGMRHEIAFATTGIAAIRFNLGEYEAAERELSASLDFVKQLGFPRWVLFARLWLGASALALGRQDEAMARLETCIDGYRELDQTDDLISAQAFYALATLAYGDHERAGRVLREALVTTVDNRSQWGLVYALPVLALYLAETGLERQAIVVRAHTQRFPPVRAMVWIADLVDRRLDSLTRSVPAKAAQAAKERGRAGETWTLVPALLAKMG